MKRNIDQGATAKTLSNTQNFIHHKYDRS